MAAAHTGLRNAGITYAPPAPFTIEGCQHTQLLSLSTPLFRWDKVFDTHELHERKVKVRTLSLFGLRPRCRWELRRKYSRLAVIACMARNFFQFPFPRRSAEEQSGVFVLDQRFVVQHPLRRCTWAHMLPCSGCVHDRPCLLGSANSH